MKSRTFFPLATLFCVLFALCSLNLIAKPISGTVLSVDRQNNKLKMAVDEQLLTVEVAPGDAQLGYEGRQIRGELTGLMGQRRLDSIWPDEKRLNQYQKDTNLMLRQDTVLRGQQAYREVGEYLPPFALINQNGELVSNDSLQGKNLVINFIFTRCQQANMCPAAIARMARLQREIENQNIDNVQLITISFDPEYDTPGQLNAYGSLRGISFDNYDFLTGDPYAIKDLTKQFGVIAIPDEEYTVNHTLATLIVNDKGKIVYRKDGSRWSAKDFAERIAAMKKG